MPGDLEVSLRIRALVDDAARRLRQIRGETRGAGQSAQTAARQTRAYGRAWDSAAAGMGRARRGLIGIRGLIAGLGLAAAIRGVIRASAEQQASVAQVRRGIRNLGDETTLTVEDLQRMASTLQDVTTFGDEATLKMQALLLTFRNIDPTHFERTTEAALDMAVALSQQPREAALQLAKALEDPVRGLTALRRSGTVFSEDQQEVIKALVETGRAAEAQGLILDEIERQYGGAARAARETLGGALAALKNAFGDLLEGGEEDTRGLREEIERLTVLLQDPDTRAAARGLGQAIAGGLSSALRALRDIQKWIADNPELAGAIFGGAVGARVAGAPGALVGAGIGAIAGIAAGGPVPEIRALEIRLQDLQIRTQRAETIIAAGGRVSDERFALLRKQRGEIASIRADLARLRSRTPEARNIAAGFGDRDQAPEPAVREERPDRPARALPAPIDRKRQREAEAGLKELENIVRAAEDRRAQVTLSRIELVDHAEARALENLSERIAAALKAAEGNEELKTQLLEAGTAARLAIEERAAAERQSIADEESRRTVEAAARAAEAAEEEAERGLRASRHWRDGAVRALRDYSAEATDAAANVEQAVTGGLRNMEDALVRFVTTGKLSFKGLVDAIIADLARIAVRQAITGPLAAALGSAFAGGGGLGGGSFSFGSAPAAFHGGGIAGRGRVIRHGIDPRVFIGAPRLHRGGIAGDEVPTILRRREGVFTPEQMAALGTRLSAPAAAIQVDVNVENRGTPQRYERGRVTRENGRLGIALIARDIAEGGDTARAIEGRWGLTTSAAT